MSESASYCPARSGSAEAAGSWRICSGFRIGPGRPSSRTCRMGCPGRAPGRRPPGDLRPPACAQDRVPVARRSGDVRATDSRPQPLHPLVLARRLAAHVREDGSRRPRARGVLARQHPRESAPLGPEHKRGRGQRRSASRAGVRQAKSMHWPILKADRSPLPCRPGTLPTSTGPLPSRRGCPGPSASSPTRPTTP